ncbi:hypothetical protein VNI00_008178 [Paramarasmius palmivorus]|uniref:Uncharacterized protein n=1 Tax=Paramarasmius palmivorus TaxID=297713 RepID=A0AAW0CV77_9AGAR
MSIVGFGKRIGWSKEDLIPVGHKLSFEETFRIVSSDIFIKVIVPNWLPNITEKIGRVRLAFDELKAGSAVPFVNYMQDIIDAARASGAARQKDDLFSNLLQANELAKDEEGRKLDDSELIDEQERLYEDIMSVCPEGLPVRSLRHSQDGS